VLLKVGLECSGPVLIELVTYLCDFGRGEPILTFEFVSQAEVGPRTVIVMMKRKN
jgi:hypothetical protein